MVGNHVGESRHDLERAVDLVPEVDHAQFGLELAVDRGGPDQLDPLLGRDVGPGGSVRLQHLEPLARAR